MPLILTAAPAVEPVSLAEAKAHLRVDETVEDALINSLILAARLHVERALDAALIEQGWSLYLDAWPEDGAVSLPLGPVMAVNAVRIYSAADAALTLSADLYFVDTASPRARIVPRGAGAWPLPGRAANGIEIAFTAGFGASAANVPQILRQAILLLVAHWYEEREPIALGQSALAIPHMVSELIAPYRKVRL